MTRHAGPARSGRAASPRQLRVGEELRHALSRILQRDDIRDPDLAGRSITVTEVRVSPDLRNATAFVTPLGGGEVDAIVAAFTRAAPHLRACLAREMRLKFMPKVSFQADTSFDAASEIDRLLHQPGVARDLAPGSVGGAEGGNGA
ncbi:MAG: 30S ribosome-binding factor RbfA [Alphaproteobacteria bacterium]